jgi:hypothetical protein
MRSGDVGKVMDLYGTIVETKSTVETLGFHSDSSIF